MFFVYHYFSSMSLQQNVVYAVAMLNNYDFAKNITEVGQPVLVQLACVMCRHAFDDKALCNDLIRTYSRHGRTIQLLEQAGLRTVQDATSFLSRNISLNKIVVSLNNTDHEIGRPSLTAKFYVMSFILLAGIMGNMTSFVLFNRLPLRRFSVYNYLAVLSIADTLVLLTGLLPRWWTMLTRQSACHISSQILCHILCALYSMFNGYVAWLLVFVSIERYAIVFHPRSASLFCSRTRALFVLTGLLGLVITINSQALFVQMPLTATSGKVMEGDHVEYCRKQSEGVETNFWLMFKVFLRAVLPFFAIVILNSLIIRRLLLNRRQRSSTINLSLAASRSKETFQLNDQSHSDRRHSDLNSSRLLQIDGSNPTASKLTSPPAHRLRLTLMVLTMTFVCLTLSLPWNLKSLSPIFMKFDSVHPLFGEVADFLLYCVHAIKYYLYCLMVCRQQSCCCAWLCCKSRETTFVGQADEQTVRSGSQTPLQTFQTVITINMEETNRSKSSKKIPKIIVT